MRRYSLTTLRRALVGDFRVSIVRTAFARLRGRPITLTRSFRVVGMRRIEFAPGARLLLGTAFFGFVDRRVHGLIRVRGRLRILGNVKIAAGCRFDVLDTGTMTIGDNTYFSPNVLAVVAEAVTIGRDCAIAWGVQLLDDDRHAFRGPAGLRASSAPITIGDRVWIGNGVHVYKGVSIADGCVVAGNSTVTRSFDQPNSLIGGSPARVLRSDVKWE
ncbi:MAG: acyltransferase [Actinomycetota bacterium]|nr:acyltransferase [Actinomycetota bacterium]